MQVGQVIAERRPGQLRQTSLPPAHGSCIASRPARAKPVPDTARTFQSSTSRDSPRPVPAAG